MKFGHSLSRNQVPEWSSAYINYKSLKKLIRSAAERVKDGEDPDLAAFLYSLERNLEDVDTFYNRKLGDVSRQLKLLHARYDDVAESLQKLSDDEANELQATLLELKDRLKKVQWYGEVNRQGFVKIVKKLDKKVPGTHIQPSYMHSKLSPKLFATNVELLRQSHSIDGWLAELQEVRATEGGASSSSSDSARRVWVRTPVGFDDEVARDLQHAIREDDTEAVRTLLSASGVSVGSNDSKTEKEAVPQLAVLNMLQHAISCKARRSMDALLGHLDGLDGDGDINQRNCIHRLVITSARSHSTKPGNDYATTAATNGHSTSSHSGGTATPSPLRSRLASSASINSSQLELVGAPDDRAQLLEHLLCKLRPVQRSALKTKDAFGRLPLHYAATAGLVDVCKTLGRYMQLWDQYDVTEGLDGDFWPDGEGMAPVHLSALSGHVATTKALIDAATCDFDLERSLSPLLRASQSGSVLNLVTRANHVDVVRLLLDAGVDANHQDDQGETALHVAARFGYEQCVRVLLNAVGSQKADTEIAEKAFGWTPLFVACVEGHLGIVQHLLSAGAQPDGFDMSGWTAKEHAALRGHLKVARCLAALPLPTIAESQGSPTLGPLPSLSRSFPDDKRPAAQNNAATAARAIAPIKTFGHRYLREGAMILVSLGTMDSRKTVDPVTLELPPGEVDQRSTPFDSAVSVVVSAVGASGEASVIDLPVRETISVEPVAFITSDPAKVQLFFDIVPTYRASSDHVIGRAVALLSSIRPGLGSKRCTLQGDISVPVVAASTLQVIGSVHFNFLVVTPFHHPNMAITEDHTYWKSMTSTTLIGHRGLGKNFSSRKSLQLGENTIESFIAAANLGATYVEFDVQLTKDHVPVIYHDFLVSETGIDAPVHALTLEQFLHISDQRTPRPSRPPSPVLSVAPVGSGPALPNPAGRKQRSYSDSSTNSETVEDMRERMKHTRDFKIKGFKGNSRGNVIQAPFTTLEEMFKKLPESVGFNIEMKYPMLSESEEQGMDTYAVEPNSFVDSVLEMVLRHSGKRHIMFSSFNPDICLLLSLKQPSIPVLFLTDAGSSTAGDIRASSLQEAIRFASRWNLLGIVTSVEPLLLCPRLVRAVKESGLVCVSYGTMNNVPENVQLQVKEGIDAVIVDSVLAIRKGLTGGDVVTPQPNGNDTTKPAEP